MVDGRVRRVQSLNRTGAALVITCLLAACGPGGTAMDRAVSLGMDPAGLVDIGTAAVGPSLADGRVTIVAIHERDGQWVASPLSSSPGLAGSDSLHLISYGGATGEAWNTLVFGTAAPGTMQVTLDGFPEQRGGTVDDGAWVIALRDKDLDPADIHWTFMDADGSTRSGTGIFPPDA